MEVKELILRDEVYAIVGAAMEVHSALGLGILFPRSHTKGTRRWK